MNNISAAKIFQISTRSFYRRVQPATWVTPTNNIDSDDEFSGPDGDCSITDPDYIDEITANDEEANITSSRPSKRLTQVAYC